MESSFLQTPEWLAFQRALGRKVWRLDDGMFRANIIRHEVRLGKNFLYIPHGPELAITAGIRNEVRHFADHVRSLAKEQGSMFVKMEPLHDAAPELLIRNGMKLKLSPRSIQPSRTVIVDLAKDEDELLSDLHHKTRYNIRVAERHGVMVNELTDTEVFWKLLQKTGEREKFRPHPRDYYQKLLAQFSRDGSAVRARLFGAFHEGKPVAAAIILEHGDTAYYLHGASDRDKRALMAPHLLHWQVMLRSKGAGLGHYDFWGIDPARYPGVSRFKLGWGGRTVERPGSFDLVLKPFWRWVWGRLHQ